MKLLRLKREIDPNIYEVALRVTDGGTPQMSQVTGLRVEVCDCENGACKQRIVAAAFGIPGILAILGAILALLSKYHLNFKAIVASRVGLNLLHSKSSAKLRFCAYAFSLVEDGIGFSPPAIFRGGCKGCASKLVIRNAM